MTPTTLDRLQVTVRRRIPWILAVMLAAVFFTVSGCSDDECGDCPGGLPDYFTYKVLNTYPHEQTSFTQGLVIDKGDLFESTGLYGRSTLRRDSLETGEALQKIDLESTFFAEGIAVWENRSTQLTWKAGMAFVYDRDSFAPVDTFTYQGEGWGLTDDGLHLLMSDGTAMIRFRDPETFAATDSILVREKLPDGSERLLGNLNELEYINGVLFANVWGRDLIAMIDPSTGWLTGWLDLVDIQPAGTCPQPVDVLNGIAWNSDTDQIYVTGKRWCGMYEIEIVPGGAP